MPYELRNKRERRQNARHPMIDKSYYLPYVDDSATPEEIMKKFEALEEIQKKKAETSSINSGASNDNPNDTTVTSNEDEGVLDDNELHELLNRIGTVFDDLSEDDEGEAYEVGDDSFDDDSFDDFDYSDETRTRSHNGGGSVHLHYSKSKHLVDLVSSKAVSRKCYRIDQDINGKLKLVFVGDVPVPYPYEYIRIPQHIPLTWTHTVAPYQPPLPDECIYTNDPTSFNFSSLGKTFNVIFINTPLNYDCSNFRKLAIGRKVIPTGFVFVWADKENIPTILNIFEEKGFFYVENLVWVQQHYEDTIEMNETVPTLLRRSKRTLLILRRGKRQSNGTVTFDAIDMRHQRNPDVLITPFSEMIDSLMQRSIYTTIETLVPRGEVGGLENSNYYLQIFGEKGKSRKNWIIILPN